MRGELADAGAWYVRRDLKRIPMGKRSAVSGGRLGRNLTAGGMALAAGLVVLTCWIAARAATPTVATPTASTEDSKSVSVHDAEKSTPAASTLRTTTSKSGSAAAIPQVEIINEAMRKSWADHHLVPSGSSPPMAIGAAAFILDVIGRIPRLDELNRFLGDKSSNRRVNLVDRLLGEEYVEEYARNWSGIWTNLLIGRPGRKRDDEKLPTDRDGMEQYLRRAFEKNKHYRQMVYDLVSATGANKPGEERLQRRRELPHRQDGRQRHPSHCQDGPNLPRSLRAVHAVPQSSVQRVEAEFVLGIERLLPADEAQ